MTDFEAETIFMVAASPPDLTDNFPGRNTNTG
jgi:hypothetical protein